LFFPHVIKLFIFSSDSNEPLEVIRRAIDNPENEVEDLVKIVKGLQQREKFGNIERTNLIFEACFTDNILKELKPRAEFIKAVSVL
jgi:predicted transcriptional regulator